MSEQFTKSKDNQIQQNGLIMSVDEVVDYLNTSNNAIGSLQYENAQLQKENKRLKERNDELEDELEESSTFIIEQREENKQLKEELQRFKKYVFSQDNILCYKCEHCIKKDIYVVDCEMKGEVDVHGLCSLFREVKV